MSVTRPSLRYSRFYCDLWTFLRPLTGQPWGIPLVSFITLIVAYDNLSKDGVTSWDRDSGTNVEHGKINGGRVIAAIVVLALIIVLDSVALLFVSSPGLGQ